MAVFVNISQFMCLGRFSAVSFQVASPFLCDAAQQTFASADQVRARLNVSDRCKRADCGSHRHFYYNPRFCTQKDCFSYCAWQQCSLYNMADMLLQVLGHTKTILVLLGGWMFLGDHISGRQFGGMCLAVAGMVAYGVESSK